MQHLTATITESLTDEGILHIKPAFMTGTIFYQGVKGGAKYRIDSIVKIDGWGAATHRISRCNNGPLTDFDKSLLTEGKKIKALYIPGGRIKPGYDL